MEIILQKIGKYDKPFEIKGYTDYEDSLTNSLIEAEMSNHANFFLKNEINLRESFAEHSHSDRASIRTSGYTLFPEFISSYHTQDYYELNIVMEGKCYEYINGSFFSLNKGDIIIIAPGTARHCYYAIKGANVISLLIKKDLFAEITEELERFSSKNFMSDFSKNKAFCLLTGGKSDRHSNYIEPLFHIYKRYKQNTHLEDVCAETATKLFFYNLQILYEKGEIKYELIQTEFPTNSTDTILEYIKGHYTNVTMAQLVEKFGYSERQIYRMIKAHTGKNFQQMLVIYKLQRSKYLLETTDYSVKKISELIGYDSPEYFSRLFKRECNCTPLQYRSIYMNH